LFQKHFYGQQVTLLDSPFLNGILAKLCSPQTFQPEINRLVHLLYTHLISTVIDKEFEHEEVETPTRMSSTHPGILLKTKRPALNQKVACVNLARAGTYPSHVCYDFLHEALPHGNLRQDHIFASRLTDEGHQVTGTHFGGSKIGGGVENSFVVFPDPMGATGNTIVSCLDYYKSKVPGPAKKYLAVHLIVTPEYLKTVLTNHPDLNIYAIRVDRGLSDKSILSSGLGEFWDKEKGLNQNQYIVPGGGGFGEIMNNSFV
jgi:uracil phosphoribosyltransferase